MTTSTTTSWWATSYPDRYYAYANTTVTLGGDPTVGWVDVAMFSSAPAWLPAASDMIALTDAEWSARSLVNQIIKDGKVQTYVPETTTATTASTTTATTSTAS
ncbi:hypothetical protein [Acetobacter syzygii]|uniref:hypothetical protein n=1 Tax=Acetobacter syzygii TaxID=146476 RepID=UPI00156D6EBC|nr:hypothetical protein [Acetobacter syzygii]NSL91685.1 hypothetical protein [Acetobacter syzygii]